MLSKLTFSLTSLIVLLMMAVCLPVMAQTSQTVNLGPSGDAITIPAGGFYTFGNSAADNDTGLRDTGKYSPIQATIDVNANAMQDLEAFFSVGGTVELIITTADGNGTSAATGTGTPYDNAIGAAAVTTIAADPAPRVPLGKDLVISEIMWGLDVDPAEVTTNGVNFDLSPRKQWIEVYNTTDRAIAINDTAVASLLGTTGTAVADVTESGIAGAVTTAGAVQLSLKFTPFTYAETADKAPLLVSDRVGNLGTGGRFTIPGQSGVTELIDRFNAPPQSNIISAYRNINYEKVEGVHKLTPQNNIDAVPNRKVQLEDFQPNKGADGTLAASWIATPVAGSRNMARWHIGTPGEMHVVDTQFTFAITKTTIPSNSVVINEIRNSGKAGEDWVELYNAGTEPVGLHDWELSAIKSSDQDAKTKSWMKTDVRLVGKDKDDDDLKRFPANEDFKLGVGEYLLIVERHPSETSLANGVDIDAVAAGNEVKAGASHQYIVRDTLDLDGVKMLILRSGLDKNSYHNKDDSGRNYMTSVAPSELIMDYAGAGSFAVGSSTYNTAIWPFRGWTAPADTEGIPSGNAFARLRYNADDGHHKDAWEDIGHKGGIGYQPGVSLRDAPGTPGYANTALLGQLFDDKGNADATDDVTFDGDISISEIMYDAGPRSDLIQWIELYNSSMSEAINLKDWEMEVRNASDDVSSYVDSGFVFNDAVILPNQTLLLVSGTSPAASRNVPANRVYNLYQHHRRELGLANRRSVLLSPVGFYLKLTDKTDADVDEAGNVMVEGAQRLVQWALPAVNPDMRQSIVRGYGDRGLYDGTSDAANDGTLMASWNLSDVGGAGSTFYGHRTDVGSPADRLGGPLPVSLSKFRPLRNQDTGHVDIQWITESELNNAGFNILRSVAKNGEFKVINVKGIIAGHGTTSEQHVYKYTDTTAKPNVVYYYQIEDVSIDGMRTTLATTHLRGDVSAAGKVTTTWGDLKLQK